LLQREDEIGLGANAAKAERKAGMAYGETLSARKDPNLPSAGKPRMLSKYSRR